MTQELPAENLLARETSPYLRQHADNPVHWRPWSREALGEAQARGVPILLSIGYAACHWCHVMAHESFEDPDVADVMNRLFVNIKVDREERPDIDQIYMAALTAMGEQGGWPLTMFLTPEGQPFWGGTYFPKQARYGRPGIVEVLEAVARTWQQKKTDLEQSAGALAAHVQARLAPAVPKTDLSPGALRQLADAISASIDPVLGGLRGAPKFPNVPFMHVLWLDWKQNGSESSRSAVLSSLRHMLAGGIYDHIGGGLCRYATDEEWLVPHFEKMLYDNALLVQLASWAYADTRDELFRVRIEETVEWLRREMLLPAGGLASSLDADSEGEEGRFYLWTREQIEAALGKEPTELFLAQYQLAEPANWEGDPIVHRSGRPQFGAADTDPTIRELKERLLDARSGRVRPDRDDKVLVDWNGLAISALANAGRVFGREDWIAQADELFRFVTESERDGRLPHSINGPERLFPGMASDHAAMILAAVDLAEATTSAEPLQHASRWLAALDRWYADAEGTGYYATASDSTDVPMRVRADVDEAVPSATSLTIRALVRLAMATSDENLLQRAYAMAEHALGRASTQSYGQAGIVFAADLAREPRKLVVVDEAAGALVSGANRNADPRRTDIYVPLSAVDASVTLPDGAVLDTSSPAARLCIGQACLPPVADAEALDRLLSGR